MTAHPRHERRKMRLTPLGWVLLVVPLLLVLASLITGSSWMWIAAVVLVAVAVWLAFGTPKYVQDLNVPPGMPNEPGDVTRHYEDEI